MDNQTLNRLNNLQQNLSRQTDIQNMLNAANLQSQIPVPSEAMQNALAAANRMSEIANAENNHNMDKNNLYVAECYVCPGPIMKRIMPRAQGRAYRILKRTSHVTIVLKEKE